MKYGDKSAANAEDDLSPRGVRSGRVVGRHEDRADEQTAGKDLSDRILTQNEGEQEYRGDEDYRGVPCDNSAG